MRYLNYYLVQIWSRRLWIRKRQQQITSGYAVRSLCSLTQILALLGLRIPTSRYMISRPEACARNRVIVVSDKAYAMDEPYDSWVKERGIQIEIRLPNENSFTYLKSIGVRYTNQKPQSIKWLEEKLKDER